MALSIPTLGFLAAAALTLGMCHHDKPKAIQQAQSVATTATVQAGLTQSVATANQKVAEKTVRVLITTQQAVQDVHAAPGADTPLDPRFLSSWSAADERVRSPAGDGPANDADPDLADQTLPPRR